MHSKKPKRGEKMKYNCKNCKFHWEGNMDNFDKVLIHEKTHLKKDQGLLEKKIVV